MVYLDWASTAIPHIHVSDYACNWFNPNSYYAIDECLEFAKCEEKVKKALGAKSGKVVFGGNTSWFFEKLYNIQSNFWLCSPYEHECVYKNGLETKDLDKTYLNDEIYCHQLVNNIIGQVFDVAKIGKKVKDESGYFICDATAAIGRCSVPDNLNEWCDCLCLSSHKLGVDNKQIGCVWVSDRFYDFTALYGTVLNGYGLVDGTPDLACAKATTDAVIEACNNVNKNDRHYLDLAFYLENLLCKKEIKHKYVNTGLYTPAICAITLPDIKADALCRYLASEHQIYISPGHSACEENSDYRVLKKYGLSQEECDSTIRVSFGPTTSYNDIDDFVYAIVEYKERYMND